MRCDVREVVVDAIAVSQDTADVLQRPT
jgi:hypothetical protein